MIYQFIYKVMKKKPLTNKTHAHRLLKSGLGPWSCIHNLSVDLHGYDNFKGSACLNAVQKSNWKNPGECEYFGSKPDFGKFIKMKEE